jgi:hypothetical protein
MRLLFAKRLFASLVTMAAIAVVTPSFAQEAATATPTPAPATKPIKAKPGTAAYCNTLKSDTSKAACLKRVHAAAAKTHKPATATAKKTVATKDPSTAAAVPATPLTPAPSSGPGPVAVPPLPQKTI